METSSKEALLLQILSLRTRGEIKRLAKALDNDSIRLPLLYSLLNERGYSTNLSTKKGIRILMDREANSRLRSNPIHVDVSFDCMNCGRSIPPGGALVRDHCPFCLSGRHVDINPGDRAAECGALLRPISFDVRSDIIWIHYQCSECSHQYRVRAHPDDQIPYSLDVGDVP